MPASIKTLVFAASLLAMAAVRASARGGLGPEYKFPCNPGNVISQPEEELIGRVGGYFEAMQNCSDQGYVVKTTHKRLSSKNVRYPSDPWYMSRKQEQWLKTTKRFITNRLKYRDARKKEAFHKRNWLDRGIAFLGFLLLAPLAIAGEYAAASLGVGGIAGLLFFGPLLWAAPFVCSYFVNKKIINWRVRKAGQKADREPATTITQEKKYEIEIPQSPASFATKL